MKNNLAPLLRVIFLIILCNLLLIAYDGNVFQSPTIRKNALEGEPYRYTSQFSGTAGLTDYCIQDKYAYLLFEGVGILKVYDLSGNYLHSFAFYTVKNGSSMLHADTTRVYLEDQLDNIYCFSDGEFKKFYSNQSKLCPKQFNDYQKRISSDAVQYKKKWASIIAVMPNGTQKTIVSRPFYLVWVDNHAPIIINIVLIFGVIVACMIRARKK